MGTSKAVFAKRKQDFNKRKNEIQRRQERYNRGKTPDKLRGD